ncbi:MAG TPA: hypothetical protein VIT92_09270 [Burkholderiaceae bacterium]
MMPATLLLVLACCQTVVLYVLCGPVYFRLIDDTAARRNPLWLEAHPVYAARVRVAGYAAWLSRLAGLGWLAWFVWRAARHDLPSAAVLLGMPALVWVAIELLYWGQAWLRVARHIPPPNRRRASIAPRALADLIHPGWIVPALFATALAAGLYLAAFERGDLDTATLLWRAGGLLAGLALWGWTLRYYLRRKPRWADEAIGPAYRRYEIGETVACLYVFAACHLLLIAREQYGLAQWSDDVFFAFGSLVLQALALLGPRYKRQRTAPAQF